MKNVIFVFCIFLGFCSPNVITPADEVISIVKIGPGMAENYEDAIDLMQNILEESVYNCHRTLKFKIT